MGRRFVFAIVAMTLAFSGCAKHVEPAAQGGTNVFAVGDCVEIPAPAPDAQTPEAQGTLAASPSSCTADPSYTVGAIEDAKGACPTVEYQHLPGKVAEPSTAKLCLVPNLVADHCYEMGMPIGIVSLANCADRGQTGLLVQVTARLDVADQQACPSEGGHYAWPYPSPARTYCTLTIYQ